MNKSFGVVLFVFFVGACGGGSSSAEIEVTREVPVTVEVIREVPVTVEVIKEVPVTVEVVREELATVEVIKKVPVTVEVVKEKVVTVEVTRIIKLSPTPLPTNPPAPVEFGSYVSGDAMQAFEVAGLEIGNVWVMSPDDFGTAPMLTDNAIRFTIPSLCEDCSARVLAFDSPDDLNVTKAYYDSLSESSAAFFSWVFVHGNLLVQINGDLPEGRAREYEAALKSLR